MVQECLNYGITGESILSRSDIIHLTFQEETVIKNNEWQWHFR